MNRAPERSVMASSLMARLACVAAILTCTAIAEVIEPLKWQQLPPLPDALGVAAPFAGIADGKLLVAGGANFPGKMPWEGGRKQWLDRVWLLDAPDGHWREAGRLPRALAYGVSVTTSDGVVCVGGGDAGKHYPDAFRLTWADGKLATKRLPALPVPLANAAGAIVGDVLFVVGGAEQPGELAASNHLYSLDLSATEPIWVEQPPVPGAGRILPVAAAFQGALYVFGGAALESDASGKMKRVYLRESWSFRPDSGWKRLVDMPKPLVASPSPSPVLNGRILLLAGDDGSRVGFEPVSEHPGFPPDILAFDPGTNTWADGGKVPAPRATVPVVQWEDRFVIPSGEMRPGVRSPEVWSFFVPQQ